MKEAFHNKGLILSNDTHLGFLVNLNRSWNLICLWKIHFYFKVRQPMKKKLSEKFLPLCTWKKMTSMTAFY